MNAQRKARRERQALDARVTRAKRAVEEVDAVDAAEVTMSRWVFEALSGYVYKPGDDGPLLVGLSRGRTHVVATMRTKTGQGPMNGRFRVTVERVLALLFLILAAGCNNGERRVTVHADRPVGVFEGRTALASGASATPAIRADAVHTLTVKAEGCADESVTFTPHASGSRVVLYVVQCVLCPLSLLRLPWALSSGELEDFEPESVTIRMREAGR